MQIMCAIIVPFRLNSWKFLQIQSTLYKVLHFGYGLGVATTWNWKPNAAGHCRALNDCITFRAWKPECRTLSILRMESNEHDITLRWREAQLTKTFDILRMESNEHDITLRWREAQLTKTFEYGIVFRRLGREVRAIYDPPIMADVGTTHMWVLFAVFVLRYVQRAIQS